jgi:DNA-binding transcriptional ArsR family regulator
MPIDSLVRFFKLLGDESRLSILFALETEPCSVSQIMEKTGLSQPLVSFHLKVLREAGLVVTERKGTFVFNALGQPDLTKLIRCFEKYTDRDGAQAGKTFSFPGDCCSSWMKRGD